MPVILIHLIQCVYNLVYKKYIRVSILEFQLVFEIKNTYWFFKKISIFSRYWLLTRGTRQFVITDFNNVLWMTSIHSYLYYGKAIGPIFILNKHSRENSDKNFPDNIHPLRLMTRSSTLAIIIIIIIVNRTGHKITNCKNQLCNNLL